MSKSQRTAACAHCLKPFTYESSRTRTVCPACLKKNLTAHKERWTDRTQSEEKADHLFKSGIAGLSREDVAWRLHLSTSGVEYIERTALAKIRKHPEARKLFTFWKSEGSPTPPPGPEAGELLLNMQMELSRMREVYAVLSDPEESTPDLAAEYKQQIEAFEWELSKAIRKLMPD